jgi:hypothetical protein
MSNTSSKHFKATSMIIYATSGWLGPLIGHQPRPTLVIKSSPHRNRHITSVLPLCSPHSSCLLACPTRHTSSC